jgi:hypothetical protein
LQLTIGAVDNGYVSANLTWRNGNNVVQKRFYQPLGRRAWSKQNHRIRQPRPLVRKEMHKDVYYRMR